MQFKTKTGLRINNSQVINGTYQKPVVCPYCETYIEATPIEYARLSYDENATAFLVSYKCPACEKKMIGVYRINGDNADHICNIPVANEEKLSGCFSQISERFVAVHQQAFRAEVRDDIQIAIVGYRTALEILLKDYAIRVLQQPEQEVIIKGLRKTIDDYAPKDISSAADVVRIVGDDYTHYVNGHPEVAFKEFKDYYSMILSFIEYQYKLKNPPVSRKR